MTNWLNTARESTKGLFKMPDNALLYRCLYKIADREVQAPTCLGSQYVAELFRTIDEKIQFNSFSKDPDNTIVGYNNR